MLAGPLLRRLRCICSQPNNWDCGGVCKDILIDPNNCGGCGIPCRSPGRCEGGTCVCPMGMSNCGGTCVSLGTNPQNCGSCGNVCPTEYSCIGGKCVSPCATCTNCHNTALAGCFCSGHSCGFTSNCCSPPPPKPGCTFNGTSCYGLVQLCHYCCEFIGEYSQQCGSCIGFWQAPTCDPTGIP